MRLGGRWTWVALGLLAAGTPFLLFPGGWRTLALIVLPLIWIGNRLTTGHFIKRTPYDSVILLLMAMLLVSLFATYDIAVSLPKIAGVILGVGVFYAFVYYGRHPLGWWSCLLVFLVLGLGTAVLGLLGTQWGTKIPLLGPLIARLPIQLTGLPGAERGFNPNEVAGALLWVIPVFIALTGLAIVQARNWLAVRGRWQHRIMMGGLAAGTLFVTVVFLLTQSRGGYIGLIVVGFGLLLIALPSRRRILALGSLGLLVILVGGVAWRDGADSLLQMMFESNVVGDPASTINSFEARVEIWSRAIYAIQDFPFTGMGMNTFREVVHVLYPLFLIPPDIDIAHAHNEFLQAALDLGIPGLIAFIALYIGAFWMLRQIWQSASAATLQPPASNLQPPTSNLQLLTRPLVLGLGGGLFAHLVYGLTDAVALGAKPGILFWMLLGLIAALFEQTQLPRIATSVGKGAPTSVGNPV